MLGWVIKRGLDGGRDAHEDPDDTQVEQADTPGPVFAARAFKSALFGTPAPSDLTVDNIASPLASKPLSVVQEPSAGTNIAITRRKTETKAGADAAGDTPRRLPGGILLTPGTATSRRKRVSFGSEVVPGEMHEKKDEFRIDKNGRRPNLFGDANRRESSRTTLAIALENARKKGNKKSYASLSARPAIENAPEIDRPRALDNKAEEGDVWEEVDDDDCDERDIDITIDINEPHSHSGRYWKSEFYRYQEDAKVEMGKLLKYKQLAKSYAKMKDTEAAEMQIKLQEEREKVTQMEARISDLAGQIAIKRTDGSDRDYQELINDLTRQTARAVQYRTEVEKLEAILQKNKRAGQAPAVAASPRTQKTILETQRELRRARDQLVELTQSKEEVRRLKTALRTAERRASASEESSSENKKLAGRLAASEARAGTLSDKVDDLEKLVQQTQDDLRQKGKEVRLLQRRYDSLKDDAKARVGEAEQLMRRKNEEIAALKKQIRQDAAAATTRKPAPELIAAINDFEIAKDDDIAELGRTGSASAKLALLRHRRKAEPLRLAVKLPQVTTLPEPTDSIRSRPDKGRSKLDPLPLRQSRPLLDVPSKAVTALPSRSATAEQDDPVAAAAAAAADASRLSISSERAAAAVARIEMRRAQRKRELELARNKENLQPA
ncbi:hypothetical protein SEPCBS119000_002178 [Sporothrix epigloea]|uniref:Spindle pole body-associated protein cut12 domain-containing protein n=1 Tax=Sporothrix epigloea TaxID=1892477 RepID=A0ABP0DHG3_9PEZI